MSILNLFRKKRAVMQKKKALLYVPESHKDYLGHIEFYFRDDLDITACTDYAGYFATLAASSFDVILIMFPRNLGTLYKLREMIQKAKEGNSVVVVFEQHQLAAVVMEAGADYFVITDIFVEGVNRPMNLIDTKALRAIRNKLFSPKVSQDEANLIIEKSEFYESVIGIFGTRATQTADVREETAFLESAFRKHNCKKILDGGCGNGRIAFKLATGSLKDKISIVGVDITDGLLQEAVEKKKREMLFLHNIDFFKANLLHLPFDNRIFDAVILMWHVICDLKERHEELIREMNRVLDVGGILVFDFPDRMASTNLHIDNEGIYEDPGSGMKKYVSYVPEIGEMLDKVQRLGFHHIEFKHVNWGIPKYVVVAKKAGIPKE